MKLGGLKKPTKRDPGIPNSCPFKKEILEDMKQQQELEQTIQHEKRKAAKEMAIREEYENLTANPEPVGVSYDDLIAEQISKLPLKPGQKAFYKELLKGLAMSTLIIEVLDSRDPKGYRCVELEEKLINEGKKVMLVMNKADLISIEDARSWKQHFAQELPCFLADCTYAKTQSPISELTDLISHIRQELPQGGKIAVIGYPNSGKSSLVNALVRSKITDVSTQPGFTKKIEEVPLDTHITLIDTPGIVFAGEGNTKDDPEMLLRCLVRIDDLADPYRPVQGVLMKTDKKKLLMHYAIPDFNDISEFLAGVARKKGKTVKGGLPDYEAAAKIVLHDWASGKIPYTIPFAN